jgi:hypothetical protein
LKIGRVVGSAAAERDDVMDVEILLGPTFDTFEVVPAFDPPSEIVPVFWVGRKDEIWHFRRS